MNALAIGKVVIALLLGQLSPDVQEEKKCNAIAVAEAADREGVDVTTLVAMAWVESGFTLEPRPRSSNEDSLSQGILQAQPRYWCVGEGIEGPVPKRREGCNLMAAGVKAYSVLLNKYGNRREALCHYNSGVVCNDGSRAYASKVIKLADKIKKKLEEEEKESKMTEECGYSCGC